MIRQSVGRRAEQDPRFRWRGDDVSRIENLSDIVFALTLGIIVQAASAPVTFGDLLSYLLGIVPAAAGFFIVLVIWNAHYLFFRRYDLRDDVIVRLNAVLLLLILFIAYPIRFSFDAFFAWAMMTMGHPERIQAMRIDYADAGTILGIYCGGYAAIFAVFGLMYAHALRRADDIGLSSAERVMTRQKLWQLGLSVALALAVLPLAAFSPMGGFAGFVLLATWPINFALHAFFDRRADTAATSEETEGTSDGKEADHQGAKARA